jgi:hypothetical protein
MSIRAPANTRSAGFIRFSPGKYPFLNVDSSTSSGIDRENVYSEANVICSKDGNLNEIVERVRVMEKLMKDALPAASSDICEATRQHNNELEGILHILKSNLSENLNNLLILLEEERAFREEVEAELEVVKSRLRPESCKQRPVGSTSFVSDEETRLKSRVAELEAECEALKSIIQDGQLKI